MFKIKRSKNKQYFVILVAANGEILSTSEMLTKKKNAIVNIAAQCAVLGIKICTVQDKTVSPFAMFNLITATRKKVKIN